MNVPLLPKIPRLGAVSAGSPPTAAAVTRANGFAEALGHAIATDLSDSRTAPRIGTTAPAGPGRRLPVRQQEPARGSSEAPGRGVHAREVAIVLRPGHAVEAADPAGVDPAPRPAASASAPEQRRQSPRHTGTKEDRGATCAGETDEESGTLEATGATDGAALAAQLRAHPHAAAGAEGPATRAAAKVISRSLATATDALRAATEGASPAALTTRKAQPRQPAPRREVPRPVEMTPAAESATATKPTLPITAEPRAAPSTMATASATGAVTPLPPAPSGVEVGGALLRSAAHLKVDVGALGAVDLHLRVRDGALHLRVDGDAAHLLEARSGELTRALAGEGLKLGSIELPHPDGSALQGQAGGDERQGRRDGWQEAANAREAAQNTRSAQAPGPKASTKRGSSIDVQA